MTLTNYWWLRLISFSHGSIVNTIGNLHMNLKDVKGGGKYTCP